LEANASRNVNCSDRNIIAAFLVEFLARTITADFGEDEAACRSVWRRSKERMPSVRRLYRAALEIARDRRNQPRSV
jgi:hypothetical protein